MDIIDFHCWLSGKETKNLFEQYLPGNQISQNKKFHHYELGSPVKIYPYHDHDGSILYFICRFDPKKFRPCDPDGKWKVKGIKPIPYNLPAMAKANSVYICEGEKDADTINKLGLVGTCKANWTGKWNQEFTAYFKGKTVYILQDADQAGKDKAQDAARALSNAEGIKIKILPPFSDRKGFDVTDWINDGHKKKELLSIIEKTECFQEKKSLDDGINGLDLFTKEFKPIRWAVHDILAEGCSILAGKPKCGKSIICLNLAIAIAAGTKAFCSIDVEPGQVLYLALEDVQRRLQTRLHQMLKGDDPKALQNIKIYTKWPKMGEGGLQKLDEKIKSISGIRLVMIDTLKKFRPVIKGNKSLYDSDYEPISAIKEIADKNNVSILLIHHLRKSDADDIMDTFSGSLGLTGATDTNLILERQTGNADAVLHINGRDVESAEYALRFQPGNMSWRILGAAQDVKSTDQRQVLYDALKDAGKALSPKDIETLTKLKGHYIRKTLPLLIEDGSIKKEGRGLYIYNVGNNGNNGLKTPINRDDTLYPSIVPPGNNGNNDSMVKSHQDGMFVPNNNAGNNARNNCKPLTGNDLAGNVPIVPIVPIPCQDCQYTDKPKELCCYLAMTGKPGKQVPVKIAYQNCPLKQEVKK